MSHVVVTVHGIRTYGKWQVRLQRLIAETNADVCVYNYGYGYFSAIAFMVPLARLLVVRHFERWLRLSLRRTAAERVDFVAHSFGTYLVAKTLLRLAQREGFKCHTVILCGSVLKSRFPWEMLLGTHVRRLVNDCGIRDFILVLNQLFILFSGMAGRVGFVGGERKGEFANRYFAFGHSDYFGITAGYPHEDEFMRQAWVPLIESESGIDEFPDQRPALTAIRGIGSFFLNNLEPIKLVLWISPFVMLTLVFASLRSDALTQMRKARGQFLAGESARVQTKFPQRSLLLAAESVDIALRAKLPVEPMAEEQLRKVLEMTSGFGLQLTQAGSVTDLALCARDDRVAAATSDGRLVVIDRQSIQQRRVLASVMAHRGSVLGIAASPDCSRIATVGTDGMMQTWTVGTDSISFSRKQSLPVKDVSLFARTRTDHLAVATKAGRIVVVLDLWGTPRTIPVEAPVELRSIAVSDDGRWLVAGESTTANDVYYWNLQASSVSASRRQLSCHTVTLIGSAGISGVSVLRFDPQGHWLLSGGNDGKVCRHAVCATGLETRNEYEPYKASIEDIEFGRDDIVLVASRSLPFHDEGSAVVIQVGNRIPAPLHVADDAKEATQVVGSPIRNVYAWALPSGEIGLSEEFNSARSLLGHERAIDVMRLSHDSRWLWSAGQDGSVRLWPTSVTSPHAEPTIFRSPVQTPNQYRLRSNGIQSITFSRDAAWLLARDYSEVFLWRRKGPGWWSPSAIKGREPSFDPSGRYLYARVDLKDNLTGVGVWKLTAHDLEEEPNFVLGSHQSVGTSVTGIHNVSAIATTPDGLWVAVGDGRGMVSLEPSDISNSTPALSLRSWSDADNEEIFAGHLDDLGAGMLRVASLAVDEHASMLFAGNYGGRTQLWKIDGSRKATRIELGKLNEPVTDAAFVSSQEVVGVSKNFLLSWRLSEKSPSAVKSHVHAKAVESFATCTNAVATGSEDGDIQMSRTDDFSQPVTHLHGHDASVVDLAFSADCGLLASVDKSGRTLLWELPAARSRTIDEGRLQITAVAIDPAAKLLALGTESGSIRIWRMDPRELVPIAVRRAGRGMSKLERERYGEEGL